MEKQFLVQVHYDGTIFWSMYDKMNAISVIIKDRVPYTISQAYAKWALIIIVCSEEEFINLLLSEYSIKEFQ